MSHHYKYEDLKNCMYRDSKNNCHLLPVKNVEKTCAFYNNEKCSANKLTDSIDKKNKNSS